MPDSQSSEPGFEPLFVTVSNIGHFRSLQCGPSWLSCINEYLAIDSGGNVSDLALARNCCLARMLPGEAELVSEWTCLPGEAKSVKRFERSNGLDTALYKNYLYLFFMSFHPRPRVGCDDSPVISVSNINELLFGKRTPWPSGWAWDTLTMFEATVCRRSWVQSPTGAI